MGATARRSDNPLKVLSLEEQIFTQTYEFEFHQAVRLLEKMRPEATPLGEGSNPLKEALSIQARITQSPSGSDLQDLTPAWLHHPPVLTVNFMGLAGIQGPLPTPYTELVIERLREKDPGLKNFLDIFNHRLASLWHRMRKKIVLGIAQIPPKETAAGKSFLDLVGISAPSLQNRLAVSDQVLLYHAPLFWKRPRSLIGLQRLLRSHFEVPIVVKQFQGSWQVALPKDWTRIGVSGQHQILGKSAVLGQRSWCQTSGIAINIPALTFEKYGEFQKESDSFKALRDLTFFYIGEGQQVALTFAVQRDSIPPTRLNARFGLGITTWITRGAGQGFSHDPEVRMKMTLANR